MLRVLVAGAGGGLGSELTARLVRAGYDTTAADREQVDVLDRLGCRQALRALRPDVVIDCSVPGGGDGRRIVKGATQLARSALGIGAYTIYLSCAEVFDGQADAPYVESDPPRPGTALGAAKVEAEEAVRQSNPRHAVVRSSWFFGVRGHNFIESILAEAAAGNQMAVDAVTHSSPTYTLHLADALLALVRTPAYGILHLAGGGSCTRLALAKAALHATGSCAKAVAAPESHPPSPRNLVLASRRRDVPSLPEWRLALNSYLEASGRAADHDASSRRRASSGRSPLEWKKRRPRAR